ncbi:MAG TPA: undecaprenyldiphospho-muramoylpentapeptide beta-N-acetylglucosaminyltransferase [Bryobacteraceae bacterium]|nr:undecaprenyldiphospho-muramoylpentapeptide beta-N-acetylglucosaminyltransferase [Bryobacteraceae bacterium]
MAFTFVMAGGGSGGHVLPALAVARELRSRGHLAVFVGVRRGMEATLVPAENFPIEWIETGALKRVGWRQTLATLAGLPAGVWQAARILDRVRPNAVFSMGGYVAGPVLLAALWKRIPVAMMEPNAVPGFTHRHLGRYAARALVSFEETARWFPKGRTEVTGLPIREEFFAVPSKRLGAAVTILITGGSQGSQTLNRAAEESWPLWKEKWKKGAVRVIHQTGARMYDELAARFRESGVEGEISPFIANMPRAFAEADLVVSRAGMGAVSEIAAAGKPSILVPFPGASDDHQLHNAQAMEKAGAARLVLDRKMNGAKLVEEVERLASDTAALEKMSVAARAFAKPGAARRAAEILESLASGGEAARELGIDRERESRNNT